ncbi:pentatricopeptide repeat-containing protein At1g66345, mitochondrial-like [Pistacia vera]|uniref:pentatricopeptide repeat-containing protein At1g66345, mitochondrial-like n=1 Tax=Pistacia vera TaxID=55513 RepID=UPI001262BE89|nr:pentatricopeptide repeat-containing protein At1g66345, mitochondrial-like [Pistacia vera]XP_031258598.1 pentatricopeptide repeat-containing protein At1g66345, mitochondrial-like [Pistacia vera]
MNALRQRTHSLVCISLNTSKFIHISTNSKSSTLVNAMCDSLRRGSNWDTLTKQFCSVELNHSIVEKVLLKLKDPVDAKCALGFFHWSAQRKHYQHNLWSYCATIHVMVRARMLIDARVLIESVLKKHVEDDSRCLVIDSLFRTYEVMESSPLVFDLLVQAYAKMRMLEVAFDVCCYLEEHGFSLSLISFNTLIHLVTKSDKSCLVWSIYEYMLQKRRYPNEETIRSLISALCKEGKLQTYVDMLDRIHGKRCSPSVIVNTSLIFRIIEEGQTEGGVLLLKRMLQRNMILDTIAYSLVVYAKVKLGNLESALEGYEEMLKRGFSANSFVYTTFIGAYCREGKIERANFLLQEMENMGLKPYDETFNLIIEGCAKVNRVEESLSNCEKMMGRGLLPSCSAFNEMIGKLCETGNAEQANAMLTPLLDKGFLPNEITYSHLIAGYAKAHKIQEILKLYYEMESRLLTPTLQVFSSLISNDFLTVATTVLGTLFGM